jgi:peptide/nickel transport system substrate-binding protein
MMKMKKTLLIFTALVLVWFCCTDQNSTARKNYPEKPSYGGELIIGVSGDIDTFNPLYVRSALGQDIIHLLLLGLADLDDEGNFTPEIASSWEHSEDYRSLTYYLRKDAVWSDGHPITAYDVKFTYDLLMDTAVGSPRQAAAEYVKQVIAVDSFTVRFEFEEAYPDQIFDTAGEILPKHIFENVSRSSLLTYEFEKNPISSGPFLLKEWKNKQYIELVPNESYFEGRPYLDKVIFKIEPNVTNRITQLKTGEIDMLLDVPPEEVGYIEKDESQLAVYPIPGRVYNYIGYNQENLLFQSAQVRQALTMAIDRNKIIEALLYGFGRSCVSAFPPMVAWAYNDDIKELPFDPGAAKNLLAGEGWKDSDGDGWLDKENRKFQFTVKTNAGNAIRSDVAVIVQEQLKQVGIEVRLDLMEWTALLEDMRNRNFDAYIGGLSTSYYVDPTPIYHSSAVQMFNYVGYANKKVDRLIETGRVELDREKAAKTWKEVQELIYEDQPYTYLFWIDKIAIAHQRFRNVTPVTLSVLYNLEKWFEAPGDSKQTG